MTTHNNTRNFQQGLTTVIVLVTTVLVLSIFSIVLQFLVGISQSSNNLARFMQQKNSNAAGITEGALRLHSSGLLSDINKTASLSTEQSYQLSLNRTPYISLLTSQSSDRVGFGSSTSSQGLYIPTAQNSLKAIRAISAGNQHTCAIADGQVYCWGSNDQGQIGDNHTQQRLTPTKVAEPLASKYATHISAGAEYTCAIADGKVYCWGDNRTSQLGQNSTINLIKPVEVSGALSGKVATSISAGTSHTCAVAEGQAYCWGRGTDGRLGNGSSHYKGLPTPVGGELTGAHVTHISVGEDNTCAIADGKAYCWGSGRYGQIGDNTHDDKTLPTKIQGALDNKTVTDISVGGTHICAVADGKAYCWGSGHYGQNGGGPHVSSSSLVPAPIGVNSPVNGKIITQIDAGYEHTCALADGNAFCWGYGNNGRIGDGTTARRLLAVPVQLTDGLAADSAVSISAGKRHSCTISRGSAYCWGNNASGELGNNTTSNSTTPKKTQSPRHDMSYYRKAVATNISVGRAHTCAVVESKVYCWGDNSEGQLGTGHKNPVSGAVRVNGGSLGDKVVTKVSAGHAGTCVLAEGRVHCWGAYAAHIRADIGVIKHEKGGISHTPVMLGGAMQGKNVNDINMSHAFGCAAAEGEGYCWGYGSDGEFGVYRRYFGGKSHYPEPVQVDKSRSGAMQGKYITKISTGHRHACAIAEGKGYCWGKSQGGRLGDNSWGHADHEYKDYPVKVATQADGEGDIPASGTFTDIIAGYAHSCAVVSGKFYCWGYNNWWQIGDISDNVHWRAVKVNDTGVLAGTIAQSLTANETGTCGVASGKLYCWGGNAYGEHGVGNNSISKNPVAVNTGPTSSLQGKTITAVDMSMSRWQHSICAVDATGDIHCWGDNKYHQLGYPGGHDNSIMIPRKIDHTFPDVLVPKFADIPFSGADLSLSMGNNAACSINLANMLGCWGVNVNGILGTNHGHGRANGFPTPTANELLTKNASQVAVGSNHVCALAEGKVYCWGYGNSGQLGHDKGQIYSHHGVGSYTSSTPRLVEDALAGKTVTQITAGNDHTCALAEGKVYCWGMLPKLLGYSVTYGRFPRPTEINYGALAGKYIRQISAGDQYTCALAENDAYCWGRNDKGQLGNGDTRDRVAPTRVTKSGLLTSAVYMSSISTGASHACLIAGNHTYCWGDNSEGQIGHSSGPGSHVTTPRISLGNPNLYGMTATRVSAGYRHTCAIVDEKPYCWGNATRGQLGFTPAGGAQSTSRAEHAILEPTRPNRTATRISSGFFSSCALSHRDVFCWGDNSNGILGNGTRTNSTTPVKVPGIAEIHKALRY